VSQEDVQLVRQGFLAASSGDPVAAQDTFDPLVEWDMSGGASVDQRRYFAVTVRGGRAVRFRMFSDRGDAIEAAGLSA
jgi:ketosteroid isomerase-like protein